MGCGSSLFVVPLFQHSLHLPTFILHYYAVNVFRDREVRPRSATLPVAASIMEDFGKQWLKV